MTGIYAAWNGTYHFGTGSVSVTNTSTPANSTAFHAYSGGVLYLGTGSATASRFTVMFKAEDQGHVHDVGTRTISNYTTFSNPALSGGTSGTGEGSDGGVVHLQ